MRLAVNAGWRSEYGTCAHAQERERERERERIHVLNARLVVECCYRSFKFFFFFFFFYFLKLDLLRYFKSTAIALRKTRTYCGSCQVLL